MNSAATISHNLTSESLRKEWDLAEGVTYLNHGSFGPTPRVVADARNEWSQRLIANPMDFYLRTMEPSLDEAANRLSTLIGAEANDLVFVDNATVAMNVVASSLPLSMDDEIILNTHEYGAVFRIWRSICEQTGAKIVCPVIESVTSDDDVVQPILNAITTRTKLIVVSHVTSATAIVFPVSEICRKAREKGIPVCIDGPHAIAMRNVSLKKIESDFYCASLHKWLSAPFGSGFLHVRKKWQQRLKAHMTSWGRSLGGRPTRWQDGLNWLGTRDPAPFLAVPAAIDFLERMGLKDFQQTTHELARYARLGLESIIGNQAPIPDSIDWYGSMIAVPIGKEWNHDSSSHSGVRKKNTPNAIHPLQQWLWSQHKIETLVTESHGQHYLRISCHLYNTRADIDYLMQALRQYQSMPAH